MCVRGRSRCRSQRHGWPALRLGSPKVRHQLLRSVAVAKRIIPQRELRNQIGEILRAAEAGTEFTVTVRGRPVARLGPPDGGGQRAVEVPADAVRRILAEAPVDDGFAADISGLRDAEPPADDPWPHA
jgi:prevent-host-death family protein